MQIINIVEQYPDVNITVKAGELKEWAEYIVRLTHQELEQQVANVKNEIYINRNEVAKMLGVDKSTLWRWGKQNYLVPIEVGGKRMYKMNDVKQILGEGRHGSN
ncbi:helix-turn-helix domain-containing protein [Dysgonomonas sp. GY75]|uniref:helix-turn-helix domain-containing protein n=1 Tax=Dysgonomonas sp. GY75 TaxID=2780419 RepID=UPI0018836594|nr:helix-turn-helix domain-containing protein [Dysgonomonas sp. GY75]MBF0651359.1 helix-turn-helix domain-containing protein [Dysgonomonas sp. GY75]